MLRNINVRETYGIVYYCMITFSRKTSVNDIKLDAPKLCPNKGFNTENLKLWQLKGHASKKTWFKIRTSPNHWELSAYKSPGKH